MKQIMTILDVIKETYPDKTFTCVDGDFSTVEWGDCTPLKQATVEARVIELQKETDAVYEKNKTDKLSAYRKLSMTDDEIKALDPTLLEE